MKLNLGSIQIPINAATKTFAVLAKRGAGKTYTAGVMAEEFFKYNIPFIVFDPIDVWWGLRLNKNGKDNGLPVVVFGLEHADIKLDRDMGRRIAQAIIRENVSCVISTFGLAKVAQRHLVAEFAEEILNINNSPRHVFIEEAHEFVPQRVFGALGKTFNAVSNLVVMGRNRGLGVTLINQRAATINKDVLTQLDTLLVFRNVSPQDRKALKEWVEYHAAEGDFEKFMKSLPSLPTGEGWIWSPEFLKIFSKIKIRKRETFHPDREKLEKFTMPTLNQIDVQNFIERFSKMSDKPTAKEKPGKTEIISMAPTEDITILKNKYESELMQKDIEIRNLKSILTKIQSLSTVGPVYPTTIRSVQSASFGGNIQMWLEKLGNGGTSRILRFLAEKSGMKFTRSQIGLAVGYSSKSGSFATYMAILKRNNLIIEQNKEVCINPDL